MIKLTDLAKEFNIHQTTMLRRCKKQNRRLMYVKNRGVGKGSGQKTYAISSEEADEMRQEHFNDVVLLNGSPSESEVSSVFYVVKDGASDRVKCGFAADMPNRMRHHKTLWPDLKIQETFVCTPSLERAYLQVVAKNLTQVCDSEVFFANDESELEKMLVELRHFEKMMF